MIEKALFIFQEKDLILPRSNIINDEKAVDDEEIRIKWQESSTELTEIVPRAHRNILRTCMHACSCCSSACRSCTTEAAAASAVVEARLPGRAQLEMETYRFLPVRLPLPVVLHCCSNCRLVSAAFYSSFSTVLKTLQQDWFFFVLYFLLFNDDGYFEAMFCICMKNENTRFFFFRTGLRSYSIFGWKSLEYYWENKEWNTMFYLGLLTL